MEATSEMIPGGEHIRLRLYVAQGAPNSGIAERNLRALLEEASVDAQLEVLDVFEHAEQALEDGVLVTPMVVRVAPEPRLRVAGSFTDGDALAIRLQLSGRRA